MLPNASICGLPICLSAVSRPLYLSQEMDDHERRREAMKMKFQENMQLHEVIRAQTKEALGNGGEIHERGVKNGKNTSAKHQFSCTSLPCTAKAA